MLQEKYAQIFELGKNLNMKNVEVKEEGGKLLMRAKVPYQLEKDLLWDKIKTYGGWENEVVADIQPENTDIYGIHTVRSGDTLSKLAKQYLGEAKRYMDIFNANKDVLTNPDMIKAGQALKIPK
jgi:LysM repeat protein